MELTDRWEEQVKREITILANGHKRGRKAVGLGIMSRVESGAFCAHLLFIQALRRPQVISYPSVSLVGYMLSVLLS